MPHKCNGKQGKINFLASLHAHLVLTGGITRTDLEQLWGLGSVSAEALLFAASIFQTDVKKYSILMVMKAVVCGVYDVNTQAYTNIITRIL